MDNAFEASAAQLMLMLSGSADVNCDCRSVYPFVSWSLILPGTISSLARSTTAH
jgi:hypothetical protein